MNGLSSSNGPMRDFENSRTSVLVGNNILAALAQCSTGKLDSQQLGYALRRHRERIAGGLRFTKVDDDNRKTGLWAVEEV